MTNAREDNLARSVFVGRARELEEINRALRQRSVAVLSGMPGVGKTSLANVYRQTNLVYDNDRTFRGWGDFQAFTPTVTTDGSLSLVVIDDLDEENDLAAAVVKVGKLLEVDTGADYLLLTRLTQLPAVNDVPVVRVTPLSREESVELVGNIIPPASPGFAEEIIKVAGTSPLAINLVARAVLDASRDPSWLDGFKSSLDYMSNAGILRGVVSLQLREFISTGNLEVAERAQMVLSNILRESGDSSTTIFAEIALATLLRERGKSNSDPSDLDESIALLRSCLGRQESDSADTVRILLGLNLSLRERGRIRGDADSFVEAAPIIEQASWLTVDNTELRLAVRVAQAGTYADVWSATRHVEYLDRTIDSLQKGLSQVGSVSPATRGSLLIHLQIQLASALSLRFEQSGDTRYIFLALYLVEDANRLPSDTGRRELDLVTALAETLHALLEEPSDAAFLQAASARLMNELVGQDEQGLQLKGLVSMLALVVARRFAVSRESWDFDLGIALLSVALGGEWGGLAEFESLRQQLGDLLQSKRTLLGVESSDKVDLASPPPPTFVRGGRFPSERSRRT